MNKKLLILITVAIVLIGGAWFLSSANIGTDFVWQISNGGHWLLPLVSVAALLDSINPCAFSILLLTIAFLFSLKRSRSNILQIGFSYILGLFIVYILIGLGLLHAFHLFNTPHFMAKVGAAVLIVWGLINLINEFIPSFPIKLKIPNAAHHKIAVLMEKGSLPAAFGLGVLVGLCEFPCTGGPYLMVLGLLHDQATYLKGIAYLLFYNIIFILPLVVILAIASNHALYEKVQNWRHLNLKGMKVFIGLAMLALGVIILNL